MGLLSYFFSKNNQVIGGYWKAIPTLKTMIDNS